MAAYFSEHSDLFWSCSHLFAWNSQLNKHFDDNLKEKTFNTLSKIYFNKFLWLIKYRWKCLHQVIKNRRKSSSNVSHTNNSFTNLSLKHQTDAIDSKLNVFLCTFRSKLFSFVQIWWKDFGSTFTIIDAKKTCSIVFLVVKILYHSMFFTDAFEGSHLSNSTST